VSRYQKKHSPTHLSWSSSNFYQLLPCTMIHSILSVQFTYLTIFFAQVLFGLSLGLEPSTSYSIHFFTKSVSSFCNTRPYHHSLFCCSTKVMSSIPTLSLNSLLGTLSFTLISSRYNLCHNLRSCQKPSVNTINRWFLTGREKSTEKFCFLWTWQEKTFTNWIVYYKFNNS